MARLPSLPDLFDILIDHGKRLKSLETGTPLKSASIGRGAVRFSDTGIILGKDATIQSEDWDGDLGTRDAGANGWAISRQLAAFADLVLRPGSIGNDLLTEPVMPGSVWQANTGFSVAVPWSTVASQSVTVPDGCTRLEADARARVTAFYNNVGTGIDYLWAHLTVGGQSSGYYPLAVTDSGGSGTNHVFRNVLLTGLTPGASVTFALQASTSFNSWSGPTTNNEAQIGASLRWLR